MVLHAFWSLEHQSRRRHERPPPEERPFDRRVRGLGGPAMSQGMRAVRSFVALCTALVSACVPGVLLAADPLPRSVLYLDENDPGLPFAASLAGAFRTTINAGHTERIAVFSENLDLVRSGGARHEEILKTYLREKYRDTPIGVLTTVGPAALTFMLRARSELWPQIPAVFASVDPDTAAAATLPP